MKVQPSRLLRQESGAADQSDVRVSLGMVAQRPFCYRVVLLGEQTGASGGADELVEQFLRLGATAGQQVSFHHPRSAQMKTTFASRQAVVTVVAVHGRSAAEFRLDGGHRGLET